MSTVLENMTLPEVQHYAKELESLIEDKQNQRTEKEVAIESHQSKINALEFQIAQLKRVLFAANRERFITENNPQQMMLPFEVEELEETPQIEHIECSREKPKKKHPGRIALPDHLPVEEIVLEPKEDITGLECMGKQVTDKLELVAAKLFIKRYIRPKYIQNSEDGLS